MLFSEHFFSEFGFAAAFSICSSLQHFDPAEGASRLNISTEFLRAEISAASKGRGVLVCFIRSCECVLLTDVNFFVRALPQRRKNKNARMRKSSKCAKKA